MFEALFGGVLGWAPGVNPAIAARFFILFGLEVAEAVSNSSWNRLSQTLDRVPEKQWKWWLLGSMVGPAALILVMFAISDFLSKM